ncbi:MAG: tetratricopeptide repeat protein [Bacteroidia bacterium]|nr:tetratricopeptide repeat protein [Paludibacter sp.]NCB68297.1 tetratricopeptide repeat protein [Bacteroidia bacterium]
MKIIFPKEDFLYTLFPELTNSDDNHIIKTLSDYYTYNQFKPKVTIDNDLIVVEIDINTIQRHETDYQRVISLCEKGNYKDAKPILTKLIAENPTNSEYHRIMGQILSDEGDQDEAINCLIDALRWNPKNAWALLMMGNIFAKFRDDITTAMKYYDQAQKNNPNDNISLNNIGANLMQQGKIAEAKKYFGEAMKINSNYPNTHFALGMIAEIENDLQSAFYSTVQAIRLNKVKDQLYNNSIRQAFSVARNIISTDTGKKTYRKYRRQLEIECGKEIEIIPDAEILTAAKFEFAENYHTTKHTVKFKPNYPAIEHLIMHELVHLKLVIDARNSDVNKLFVSHSKHRNAFDKWTQPTVQKLKRMGVPENQITNYINGLFDGVNLLVYNTPIDLFVENMLYTDFQELQPYQFISAYNLLMEAIQSVTDQKVTEVTPKEIVSKNKIYSMVNAMQFRELFGIDLVSEFKPTTAELKQATSFFEEYLQYKDDKEPAEEYELVQHWADDLQLSDYFELVDENAHRSKDSKQQELLNVFEKFLGITNDETIDPEAETKIFLKNQKEKGTNPEVVVFMVEALEYFEGMPTEEIKKIAFDIAQQGTKGYDPEFTGYKLKTIPNKTFSGYQILAYYYVSFAIALPEVLMQLQLPYHEEYLLARGVRNGGN